MDAGVSRGVNRSRAASAGTAREEEAAGAGIRSITADQRATSTRSTAMPTARQPADNTVDNGRLTRRLELFVINGSGILGGAESWLLTLLDAASDRLNLRFVLLADGPLRHELVRRGIPVTVRGTGARALDIAKASWWLRGQLNRHDPDLVLANGIKAAAVACPAGRLVGVRTVWAKHDFSHDKKLASLLGKLAHGVIATSPQVAAAVGRKDVVVIEPPRPADPLTTTQARQALQQHGVQLPQRAKTVAMLGRYVPYKGIDTAIRALPELPDWHLVAIGGDEPAHPTERDRLAKLAAELGVAHRVQLAGFIPGASRLLTAFDALAVLTRPEGPGSPGSEGYGMAAAEAMAAGIPVVVAGDGAIASRIGDDGTGGVAGLRINHDRQGQPAAELASALEMIGGPALASAMGVEGQRRVRSQPDVASSAQRFAATLSQVALRPGAGNSTGPGLTIIAPVFNESGVINKLLEIITPQLGPADEFLLIDGGSTDDTRDVIDQYRKNDPRIQLVDDTGGNIAHSRNVGIARASHNFIACTDAGCDPGPQWVNSFRAAAADSLVNDDPGMVLGVYHVGVRKGRPFEKAMAAVAWADPVELRRPTPFRRWYGKLLGRWFLAHRVEGRSVGFSKKAFDAAGGFPEYLATAEDEAFGKNLIAAGYRSVHSLDADVVWHQRPSVASTFRQFKGYGYGGGTSRSALLLVRDVVRVAGYGAAVALPLVFGLAGLLVSIAGVAAYLSLPIARLFRRRNSPLLLPLLPACYLLKDVAKVVGTTQALLRGARRTHGG